MLTRENIRRRWLERAKARSIEKFGFNIIGIDLDKLEGSINEN